MERSPLNSLPPELKLTIYEYFGHKELLVISHISKCWRDIVLEDKRWIEWFEMLLDPHTGETIRDIMARFQLLDQIPLRHIVTLCFYPKCALCSFSTEYLFLPLLKRICHECLHKETHAVMALSAALTTYDVSEKDVSDVVVLCVFLLLRIVYMQTLLQTQPLGRNRPGAQEADGRNDAREVGERIGRQDHAGADAVTLKNAKKVQKTRPKMPAIIKEPYKLLLDFYQTLGIMRTNFLVFDIGRAAAETLVECVVCVIMENLRWQDGGPIGSKPQWRDFMFSGELAAHEEEEHIIPRDCDLCSSGCHIDDEVLGRPARCDVCLNFEALAEKEELDAAS
ncbi:hypothetical protein B0H11DRAFT_1324294 [Mycena galericulata]|nr:hypothetical protein B0H11DRAFT_1324294 [Mycena galericulata]